LGAGDGDIGDLRKRGKGLQNGGLDTSNIP
jgi:hypothetical protein